MIPNCESLRRTCFHDSLVLSYDSYLSRYHMMDRYLLKGEFALVTTKRMPQAFVREDTRADCL
jgi:hypothetical protein